MEQKELEELFKHPLLSDIGPNVSLLELESLVACEEESSGVLSFCLLRGRQSPIGTISNCRVCCQKRIESL